MSDPTYFTSPATRDGALDVDGFDSLAELALNLRSSWNHATDAVWRRLDPALWNLANNPWAVLQTVSRDKLREAIRAAGIPKNCVAALSRAA
jgi:starch phosphorylase